MLSCANSRPSSSSSFLHSLLVVTLLWGHCWPVVCAKAAVTAAVAPSAATTPKTVSPPGAPIENDTAVVSSLVHLTKVAPPSSGSRGRGGASTSGSSSSSDSDLIPASSKKFVDDFFNSDKFANQGFKKSHSSKDADGYAKHDTFHTKDGDGFGYGQHFEFDKKDGDKHGGGYHESSSYDDDDAASSMPKFSKWHFERNSDQPAARSYRYEGDGDDHSTGKLVGPDYEESKGSASRRSKRKKEPHPSATEYDNYEYADVEEAEPADFEGEEGDPEYGALYADADAYDYY